MWQMRLSLLYQIPAAVAIGFAILIVPLLDTLAGIQYPYIKWQITFYTGP